MLTNLFYKTKKPALSAGNLTAELFHDPGSGVIQKKKPLISPSDYRQDYFMILVRG
jgi:hypothetical protein